MTCDDDCRTPPEFPKAVFNRPGLGRIDHRIGTFANIRDYVLARIDAAPTLAAWTHRLPDDPAIALVEGAAIVGDILTFYQSLYANEYFLRTAAWKESVADLVRLLGYRLAPSLGGESRFAVLAKGTKPVAIPKAFGFRAQIEGQPKPAVFESTAPVTAYPSLGRFNLYRPRVRPPIASADRTFEISGQDADLELKPGDRVLLGASDSAGTPSDRFSFFQIAIVDKTRRSFDTTLIALKAGIALDATIVSLSGSAAADGPVALEAREWEGHIGVEKEYHASSVPTAPPTPTSFAQLLAFKVQSSHRHFGHDAPAQQVSITSAGVATTEPVAFVRPLDSTVGSPADPSIPERGLPLDSTVQDIAAGSTVLVEAVPTSSAGDTQGVPVCLVRCVTNTTTLTANWGPRTGPSTLLTLDASLTANSLGYADIRTINVHQVAGGGFTLLAPLASTPEAQGRDLDFYGTGEDSQALLGRSLILSAPEGEPITVTVAAVADVGDPQAQRLRRITLDQDVAYSDFEPTGPNVTVFGNVVAATQGESEGVAVLGDGDRSQAFQTFPLPKAPLTYLLRPEETPKSHAELQVWVAGIEWSRVDTFFEEASDAAVYVIREDETGQSFIQFGDGTTGARLPTGTGNVLISYRTGAGAAGALQSNTTPQFTLRLDGLDKVLMPIPAVGGTPPETQDSARVAAPGRMQSLDRLVGLSDYEAETLALPSVVKARASWAEARGTPVLRLTVLTVNEDAAEAANVAMCVRQLERAKGARRAALEVVPGRRSPVRIGLTVGYDALRLESDVREAVLEALGVSGAEAEGVRGDGGLFSLGLRQFGQSAHGSQIVGAVQQADGVVWVKLVDAELGSDTPATLQPADTLYGSLPCDDSSILSLSIQDLALSLVAVTGAAEEPR